MPSPLGRRDLPGSMASCQKKCHSTVARGPVPRERSVDRSTARDRPSPYVKGDIFRPRNPPVTVARGPVPRECPVDRSTARDRPSPYVKGNVFRPKNPPVTGSRGPRMPHAHPSGFHPRMSGRPKHGEGQALALRARDGVFFTASRGLPPRR